MTQTPRRVRRCSRQVGVALLPCPSPARALLPALECFEKHTAGAGYPKRRLTRQDQPLAIAAALHALTRPALSPAGCAPLPASEAGWFSVGIVTQTLIVHLIRTERIPFVQEVRCHACQTVRVHMWHRIASFKLKQGP